MLVCCRGRVVDVAKRIYHEHRGQRRHGGVSEELSTRCVLHDYVVFAEMLCCIIQVHNVPKKKKGTI
jgi:hypothetical protein